jgi:hypothetical protein
MALQHLRSSTANKRPVPGNMSDGQLGINTNLASPGLFFKDTNGDLVKVGPVHVGTTAPNASPAAGGTAGNSVGEQWLDTTGGTYVFKVWDGSAWRSESGTFVDVNGDVMTGALGIIAGSAGALGLYFSGDTDTGLYSPGSDQLALATGGAGRLFVDASGRVGVGTASPGTSLDVNGGIWARSPFISWNGTVRGGDIETTTAGRLNIRSYNATSADRGEIIFLRNNTAGDFESARIDSSGRLLLGTSSARSNFYNGSSYSPRLQLESANNAANSSIALVSASGSAFDEPNLVFAKSRGSAIGDNTIVASGDDIGSISFQASDGSEYVVAASILAEVDGTPGADDMPGRLVFATTADGASSPTERLRIDSSGRVGIGTTPDSPLHVVGTSGTGLRIGYTNNTNYFDANTQIFRSNNGTSEYGRWDSSGRLLVGTSSARSNFYNGSTYTPRLQLESAGSGATSSIALVSAGDGAFNEANLVFAKSRGSTIGDNTIVASGDDIGNISFQASDGSEYVVAASILAEVDGTPGADDMPGRLVFATTADGASSPTERMRLDSTGRLFLNTTASPSTSSFGTAIGTVLAHSRDTSTGAVAQIYGNAGEFRIIGSGNAQNTNNSYGAISDQSLKTDISDAGSQWDDIKGITVRKFKLIGTDTLQIGVVAQECELVSPGLVEDTVLEQEDGTTSTVKAVKYSVLYMKAVKALQEAMERIEQLEQRLADAGI